MRVRFSLWVFPARLGASPACRSAVTVAALAALLLAPGALAQTAAPTLDLVVERAGRYVVEYGEKMSVVIGVERYAQWMQKEEFARPVVRTLVSEFALVRVKDDWLGFRDVFDVDGKPVSDHQDRLQKLFVELPANAVDQGRRIAEESARHNMGAIQRNFNVPTTALFFLHPTNQSRFKFKKVGEDRIDSIPVWKVRYEEIRKPTIIKTSAGNDMPVTGTMWVDPLEGRILKTHMQIVSEVHVGADHPGMVNDPGGFGALQKPPAPTSDAWAGSRRKSSASITVTYKQEPRLGALVPAEMLETYEGMTRSAFTGNESPTKINCRATYSDFRRFETSARVGVPK